MADDPKLIVAVEARLDRFERQLKQAGLIAERELKNIEQKTGGVDITGGVAKGVLIAKVIEKAFELIVEEVKRVVAEMNKLNETLDLTRISAEQFQRVAFAGIAGGLNFDQINAGLQAVGSKMNAINHGETALSKFLDENNLKYRERTGAVIDANKALDLAATLMGRAKTEFDKITIAEKFGLTKEWVKAIGEGLEKWTATKEATAKINPELERQLKHLEVINSLVAQVKAHFAGWGLSLTTSVLPALDTVATEILRLAAAFAEFAKAGPLEDFAAGFVNRMATVVESLRAALVEADKPRVTVHGTGVKGLGEAAAEKERDAIDKAVDALKKRNELAKAELETIGLTVQKQEEARQMALLRAAAEREGKNLHEAMTAEMLKQVTAAGELQQQLAERNAKWSEMVSASRELGSIMSDAMKGLVLEGKKFDEVLKNIGNRIASKAFDKLFDIMFAAPAGGGGSIFTNLLGIKAGGLMAGGPARAGGAYLVGERGPELFVPNKSGQVIPNTALSNGGSGVTIGGQTTNVVVQGSADRETLTLMQQMLTARDRRFVADVAHATAELRRRSAFA